MDTIQRVRELANERNLTLSKLAELCNLPQSVEEVQQELGFFLFISLYAKQVDTFSHRNPIE